MKLYKLTKDLYENWVFANEKDDSVEFKPPENEIEEEQIFPLRNFGEKSIKHLEETIAQMKEIRRIVRSRTIPSKIAGEIHGLPSQQVYDWTKRGFLPSVEEKYSRRAYSVVDISWMLILKQLQDLTGFQIAGLVERIRPLIDGGILETCLIRDNHREYKPYFFLSGTDVLGIAYTKIPLPENLYKDLKIDIPVIPIVEGVVAKAMVPGFASFTEGGTRKFLINNRLISVSENLKELSELEIISLICKYADSIDSRVGEAIRVASAATSKDAYKELKGVQDGYYEA